MADTVNFSQVSVAANSTNLLDRYKSKMQSTNGQATPEAAPVTASGAEALSNYNRASIKPAATDFAAVKTENSDNIQEKLLAEYADLKPTEAKVFDKDFIANIKGEKVTNSDGLVAYYEEKGGDITKIYHTSADGKLSTVCEIDNKTGNLIREDGYDHNGLPVVVSEYNPETGAAKKHTMYDSEGKLSSVCESDADGDARKSILYNKDGSIKKLFKNDKGIDGGSRTTYKFENGKLISSQTESKDGVPLESTRYRDGKELKTIKNAQYPVINTTGYDYTKIDLKPAEIGNIELDINKVDGEKKYRSNGTLEKIVVKDGNIERTYTMDDAGKDLCGITELENGAEKRDIRFSEGKLNMIQERKEDGVKDTYFRPDGTVKGISDRPSPENGGEIRNEFFFKDGKVRGYCVEDAKTYNLKYEFNLNEDGSLVDVKEYDEKGEPKGKYYREVINFVENKTQEPDNAKSVEYFKSKLNDVQWVKTYVPGTNIVHMKQNGVIDGLEYEIFPNGTVRAYSNWGNDSIIMNSNEEIANVFNAAKGL